MKILTFIAVSILTIAVVQGVPSLKYSPCYSNSNEQNISLQIQSVAWSSADSLVISVTMINRLPIMPGEFIVRTDQTAIAMDFCDTRLLLNRSCPLMPTDFNQLALLSLWPIPLNERVQINITRVDNSLAGACILVSLGGGYDLHNSAIVYVVFSVVLLSILLFSILALASSGGGGGGENIGSISLRYYLTHLQFISVSAMLIPASHSELYAQIVAETISLAMLLTPPWWRAAYEGSSPVNSGVSRYLEAAGFDDETDPAVLHTCLIWFSALTAMACLAVGIHQLVKYRGNIQYAKRMLQCLDWLIFNAASFPLLIFSISRLTSVQQIQQQILFAAVVLTVVLTAWIIRIVWAARNCDKTAARFWSLNGFRQLIVVMLVCLLYWQSVAQLTSLIVLEIVLLFVDLRYSHNPPRLLCASKIAAAYHVLVYCLIVSITIAGSSVNIYITLTMLGLHACSIVACLLLSGYQLIASGVTRVNCLTRLRDSQQPPARPAALCTSWNWSLARPPLVEIDQLSLASTARSAEDMADQNNFSSSSFASVNIPILDISDSDYEALIRGSITDK